MKVIKAENMGFCFGVREALNKASAECKGTKLLGPIVHNKQVIEDLLKRGISVINNIDDVSNARVIVRAHGVPKSVYKCAADKNIELIDCTCPNVKLIQELSVNLEKEGYKIILFGEKEHPEVVSIASHLEKPVVIRQKSELGGLTFKGNFALLSQTTMPENEFKSLESHLKKKIKNLKVYNTTCSATKLRQSSAALLAKKVDIMIIVGDIMSNNTVSLARVCSPIVETKHIETASDIDDSWFNGKSIVGVSAGASTPDYVIDEVVEKIEKI